jgi:DNA-binding NarL/FixJ family response regulator
VTADGRRDSTPAKPARDRVLVVDDAANLRELLTLLLESEDDFEVVGNAINGQQAIELTAALRPDVVLLDLAMPVMDGLSALPEIRAAVPAARIVIFTGFDQGSLVGEALAGGADAYLEKGASVTSLVDLLRDLRSKA